MNYRDFGQLSNSHRVVIERAQEQFPVSLSAIAAGFGLKLVASTLRPGISGEIRPAGDGFVINVNRHDSPSRQRFTVAHEIAHFLLHRDQIGDGISDDVLYRSSLSDAREAEANRLAADILMPRKAVADRLRTEGGVASDDVVARLALAFGVSEIAMRIRLGLE
jgi:hypothetical protein